MLSALGEGKEDDFVRYSLDEMKSAAEMIHQILAYWRSGDRAGLNTTINEEMVPPHLRCIGICLLIGINGGCQILEYFETPAVEYVLVGAAHLVGEDGYCSNWSTMVLK